ncbi:hypothetical protein ACFT30_14430 [Microbacterium ureisolvens]|uniref:hypothetical protein n=1 Tax=Microbacterium TaxID=33882 RepID=UPI000D64E809|nr:MULTISPECIES: hypothetical protein [Microbacterium]
MTDPSSQAAKPAADAPAGEGTAGRKAAPARPSLANPNTAPVLTKLAPPFSVRTAQFFWIISFFVGGFAVVYFFIIRKEQLPLIVEAVRAVDPARNEQTYTTAADIVYWSVFSVIVGVLLVQITLLVSFMARRPHMRWWQLLTWVVQVVTLAIALDLAFTGERAEPLRLILAAQSGLVLLALLSSVMPKALAWSARKHDVVRHQKAGVAVGE